MEFPRSQKCRGKFKIHKKMTEMPIVGKEHKDPKKSF